MSKPDFVSLSDLSSTIQINANYAGEDNFTGQKVDGYRAKKILLARVVAEALLKVQAEALKLNLTLKIFDGYRPNKATLFFQKWSQLPEDNIQRKQRFYPSYAREELFAHGFIALKSSHSRGCAVDLTLANIDTLQELDMGTEFDYFNDLSHTLNPEIQGRQLENRLLLKNLMEAQGFRNYSKEWWHFSFKQEPYPDVWFDFDIE
ncbi:MAG: M15 family metallopeptidase [Bacteriovoracaceae bacterium]